jgi:4-amino-4-deoxy-L-arabinose transferase-like glycosyltransferase
MIIKKNNIGKIFVIFLTLHSLIWVLIPSLTNANLPLDTIEALAWGSNLDWGFNKHPPLSAFFPEIFYQIFGSRDWAFYLLSQLFVIFSFFIVWKFSEDFFKNKIYIFISILLLEGIVFYNFTTPEFNVNVCQLPFWVLTVLYCWKGFKNNKIIDWLLFGLFAALGVLAKYLFIYLLVSISIFLIYMIIKKRINSKCLISLVSFFIILLPHLIWLMGNDYITITYGLRRTELASSSFFDHLIYPLIFLGKQIGMLIPFFIMFLFLISKLKIKLNFKDRKLLFLVTINAIPFILMFLTSLVFGAKIKTMWMTPYYLFLGVLLIYIFQNHINLNKLKSFFSVFLFLFILFPAIYSYISISQTNKRTDYPGKEIAYLIQERWDRNFQNKIAIVVGDEWYGGNLSYHLKSRPIWFNKLPDEVVTNKLLIDEILGAKYSGGGIIYTGNSEVLKNVCPGIFGKIRSQGICMIGSK